MGYKEELRIIQETTAYLTKLKTDKGYLLKELNALPSKVDGEQRLRNLGTSYEQSSGPVNQHQISNC